MGADHQGRRHQAGIMPVTDPASFSNCKSSELQVFRTASLLN
jgi:hypothetical protein